MRAKLILILSLTALVATAVLTPTASAGVATYNSTGSLHVPDDTGPEGVTSTITVPPGRTAVQSVEVTNFTIFWPASAQELSTQFIGPDGTFLHLFTQGCANYQEQDVWIFSDSGTQTAPNSKFDSKCDLPGGTFRPALLNEKLSIFSGKPAAGTWTLRAVDNGVTFSNQGDIRTWAVRIVHAPPTLTANAPASGKLAKLALTATANANGSVTSGGGATPSTVPLNAGTPKQIAFNPTTKIRKKIKKKGKAFVTVDLTFTDETGGTASDSVRVKVKAKKK